MANEKSAVITVYGHNKAIDKIAVRREKIANIIRRLEETGEIVAAFFEGEATKWPVMILKEYNNIVGRALAFSAKARREGLLAFEEESDNEKIDERDVFEYGMRFVIDGVAPETIEKTLSNIIKQEKDEYTRILKTIQKEAVLMIQDGSHPRLLYAVLNSHTDITLKEDKIKGLIEN